MSSEKPTESIVVNFPKTEHPAGGAQNGGSDDASEIAAQEKAGLVMAEATRLANLAPGEWRVWIDRSAERFGVSRDTLEGLIVIKEQEKKQRELKAESRRQEQRVERQRNAAQREKEREQQQIQKDADRTTAQSATPKGARAVCSIDVDAITVPPDRMRKLRPEVVDNLAESIAGRGLIQAIVVKRRGAAYELVAGWHRLEAARKLRHGTIRASILDDIDADAALLMEIDENLVRADLSPAERALHIGRRKELYEKAHPETKHGGDRKSSSRQVGDSNKRFTKEVAKVVGRSERQVQRDAARANKVYVLGDVAGTSLDKGDEIDALGTLPEEEQRKLATAAKAGERVSARQHAKKLKRTSKGRAKPAAKDSALREFDGHVLRLLQMTDKAKPVRFAKTAVDAPSLSRLSRFLADIAGEQPQCTDGQKEDDAAAKVTDVI